MSDPPKVTATVVVFVSPLIGLGANLVFILAALYIKEYRKQAYYNLAVSLTSSDSIMLLLFVFYAAPSTLLGHPLGGPMLDRIMGAISYMTWFDGFIIIVTLAVNRFISICFPHLAPFWFTVEI